jgi:hypothetical protein
MGLRFGFWIMFGIPEQAVAEKLPIKGTPYTAADIALDKSTACSWCAARPAGIVSDSTPIECLTTKSPPSFLNPPIHA